MAGHWPAIGLRSRELSKRLGTKKHAKPGDLNVDTRSRGRAGTSLAQSAQQLEAASHAEGSKNPGHLVSHRAYGRMPARRDLCVARAFEELARDVALRAGQNVA
jgi:hypothetical protein